MPCNSDYMNPNEKEINSLAVIKLLKELNYKVGKYDSYYGRPKTLDKDVAQLCSACKKIEEVVINGVKNYSLELQIWWRDHQKADKERIKESKLKEEEIKLTKSALSKLTKKERKVLNL